MRVDVGRRSADSASRGNRESGLVILKFASSAFGGEEDLAEVTSEIYRHARDGIKVAAFVPAGAKSAGGNEVASLLAAHCERVGLDAHIFAAGGANAIPEKILREAVAGRDVVIVPGAMAADERRLRAASPQKLRVAIAGLGLIGEGVALRLSGGNPDYDFCAALVREPFKERASITVAQVTNDLAAFLASKPDVVIDALPDGRTGRALIAAALERGVNVVSANKQAIAGALPDLTALAGRSGAIFAYSAAVGGGAPFLETVSRARDAGDVQSIEAVLNGTVNFILTSLAEGVRFDDAIKAAQQAGFAEPDPSADLSGADARAKLAILSYTAFGREVDLEEIFVEALDAEKSARFVSEGGRWKQIAQLDLDVSGALLASVRFKRLDDDSLFTGARWEANALRVRLSDGRIVECRGKGAGRRPTVESILGDLGAIRRRRFANPPASIALAPQAVPA